MVRVVKGAMTVVMVWVMSPLQKAKEVPGSIRGQGGFPS